MQVPQGTMRLRSAGQQQSSISRTLTCQSMTNYQRTSTQSIREASLWLQHGTAGAGGDIPHPHPLGGGLPPIVESSWLQTRL